MAGFFLVVIGGGHCESPLGKIFDAVIWCHNGNKFVLVCQFLGYPQLYGDMLSAQDFM